MKTAQARTHIEVNVNCPYCENIQDIISKDSVKEELGCTGEPRSDDCEIEISCEECKETFIVTSIFY